MSQAHRLAVIFFRPAPIDGNVQTILAMRGFFVHFQQI